MSSSRHSQADSGYDGSQAGERPPHRTTRVETRTSNTNVSPPPADRIAYPQDSFGADGGVADQDPGEDNDPYSSARIAYQNLQERLEYHTDYPGSSIHHNCISHDGATQYNAPFIQGGPEVREMVSNLLKGRSSVFLGCKTKGAAVQYNAPEVLYTGNLEIEEPIDMGDYYSGCEAMSRVAEDGRLIGGFQFNAISIRREGGAYTKLP